MSPSERKGLRDALKKAGSEVDIIEQLRRERGNLTQVSAGEAFRILAAVIKEMN